MRSRAVGGTGREGGIVSMRGGIAGAGSWMLGLAAAVVVPACDRGARETAKAGADQAAVRKAEVAAEPLRIAAASDLQRVLPRLIERFQEESGTITTLTFDASGRLAEQIKAGAPFDVFLSANEKFVRDLADTGLIQPQSVRPYARGSLVLCLHRSAGNDVRGLSDLAVPEIKRIAIANPEYAPYGVAARRRSSTPGCGRSWNRRSSAPPRCARRSFTCRQAMPRPRW